MNNYKINSASFSFILICLFNSSLLGILFPYLINNTNYSLLFSLLLSFIIGLFIILLYYKIFSILPSKNIFEKVNIIFPKFNKIINLLLTTIVFVIMTIIFYRFSTFIMSEYLTSTPSIFIVLLLSSPILLASFKNVDIAGRCATNVIIASFVLFIISRFTLLSSIDVDNFKPFIFNTTKILNGSLYTSVISIIPIFISLLIPKENITDVKNIKKSLLITYVFSFIMILIILITTIGSLGMELSSIYTYPTYMVLKTLSIFDFIKNVENFSVLFWVMFMAFTCSFSLLFIKTGIHYTFKVNNNLLNIITIIIFILFIITITILLPYESLFNSNNIYSIFTFIVYLTFLLLIIILYIKRKLLK